MSRFRAPGLKAAPGVIGDGWYPLSLCRRSGWREALSTGMGDEMPLLSTRVEDVDSFRLGFTDVVDVPGVIAKVVVERNCDRLLLGVVSVSVAFESLRTATNDI